MEHTTSSEQTNNVRASTMPPRDAGSPDPANAQHAEPDNTSFEQSDQIACGSGRCSMGLIKSGCPSCFLLGALMLPFELLFGLIRRGAKALRM